MLTGYSSYSIEANEIRGLDWNRHVGNLFI